MTASSNKSTPYHRFIPREEVQQVSAWAFESMDSAKPHKGAPQDPQPEPEAPELPPVDLEALRQQAYEEGFAQGKQTGTEETRKTLEGPLKRQMQNQSQMLAQVLKNAQQQLEQLEHQLAEQVLELACDLARQVVRRELSQPLEPLKAVVHEALTLATQDQQAATLRLNPSDLALMQNDLAQAIGEHAVRVVSDPQLSSGGCVVETAQGAIDGTVERRWVRAVANLGLPTEWKPAEHADV
jgi:flagellar assembly protein FliH